MSSPSLKILIVDDTPANSKQLEAVARKLGHTAILAANGVEAIARFEADKPDLIFMDIMMPTMDGITAARRIREIATEGWTPIIFFSALDQMQDIVHALEAGGDDYIVKPASLQIVRAKINSYARVLALQQEVQANAEELRNWRLDAEEQSRLGAHVMSRLTDAAGLRDPMIRHFNKPADMFSGDLLCAARAPGEVLNVLLADATGHGLAAALSAMPLTQAFYSMTAKGFPLPSIAEELNRKLKAILPPDRFVAATLAAIDVRNQTVEVWNGGNPDALFINARGEIAMQWASNHPPLGILPDKLFSGMTETVVFHEPGDLVLCSDGLTEAEAPDGAWFGIQGVHDHLAREKSSNHRFTSLLSGIESHLAGQPGRDDISALLVSVPIDRRRQIRFETPTQAHQGHLAEWRLDLSYGAEELRYIDVVPAVLGFATQVHALKPHQGALFLIFSELFNNALDHGLLGLDSATKSWIGGFELYMRQRGERLAKLRHGRIDISFLLHQSDTRAVLDISMTDTGPGFAFETNLNNPTALSAGNELAHGRGIALVKNLCEQLVYSGNGNKVWARYLVSDLIVELDEVDEDATRGAAGAGDDTDLVMF
ncbi:MAG: fused response regulator/phosphatase [Pseudomonadota bacterium]|nr:fused response regulator/phosphatase [Pseudomonadota bacterium]MDP1903675.1 fused response regulator/phosphatase [Pseudomonadota bacterium]MDP2354374.1 fused response regulator/phosphatase [Pseudomonadota bacterium]